MNEFDTRAEAKSRAEFITPQALRQFLAEKITTNDLSVLEPAIGSGQLLFDISDKIQSIDGFDISQSAVDMCKQNFKNKGGNIECMDFITAEISKSYDVAIANYPFSLPISEEQKISISNDVFLSRFYSKDKNANESLFDIPKQVKPSEVNGVLDFIFILKSFQHAQEGFYFCFPGISYRKQEEKFRKYLIENKFIKEFGIINNCQFDHTSISILFLHLTKTPNEQAISFSLDLKTNERLQEVATFENNQFEYPKKVVEKEFFDSIEVERQVRNSIIQNLKKELDFSSKIYNLDPELRKNLPTIAEWKQEIIDMLEK